MTVVEICPGLTGYTDILAAYLHDAGHYIAAIPAASLPTASEYTKKGVAAYDAKLKADPARLGKVTVSEFAPPQRTDIAPAGSADVVLTFRNVHNWIGGGFEQQARSEEHTSELQSLMRISYAVFCLKKKKTKQTIPIKYYNKY